MTVAWPGHLPKCALYDTRRSTYEGAVREFVPDTGDPIRRKNQSDTRKMFSGTFRMTREQMNDFWTFYNTTINRGVDAFTMWDPDTETTVTVKFADRSPPVFSQITRGRHDVDLAFRVSG